MFFVGFVGFVLFFFLLEKQNLVLLQVPGLCNLMLLATQALSSMGPSMEQALSQIRHWFITPTSFVPPLNQYYITAGNHCRSKGLQLAFCFLFSFSHLQSSLLYRRHYNIQMKVSKGKRSICPCSMNSEGAVFIHGLTRKEES